MKSLACRIRTARVIASIYEVKAQEASDSLDDGEAARFADLQREQLEIAEKLEQEAEADEGSSCN